MANKKQTIIQEVVNKLEDTSLSMYDIYTYLQMHKNELLEKEKKQLEDSFHAGFFIHEWDKSKEDKFEQYYQQTFKND